MPPLEKLKVVVAYVSPPTVIVRLVVAAKIAKGTLKLAVTIIKNLKVKCRDEKNIHSLFLEIEIFMFFFKNFMPKKRTTTVMRKAITYQSGKA